MQGDRHLLALLMKGSERLKCRSLVLNNAQAGQPDNPNQRRTNMGRVIVYEYVTLDGVMEAPEEWQFPYYSDDVAEVIKAQILEPDAILLGRATYEIFAAYWPYRTHNEFGTADKLNSTPKFVVSSTLEKAEWNNSTLIKENVAEEITRLKQQPGGDIAIIGSATLVQSLMHHDLIDEYQLLVHPVVVGRGKRLFEDGSIPTALRLVETRAFSSGVVLLSYQPDRKEQEYRHESSHETQSTHRILAQTGG